MNISNSFLDFKYGCWISNGIPFLNKIKALTHCSQFGNTDLKFYYHDHIWDNFDLSLLGKISLPVLYKERAQQLRDTYDHLTLHYSGGSDSHNILYTFLKNNIRLDEISVRWPKVLRDGNLYIPNYHDKSGRNAASEWNFSIKPTLDWLAENHPQIKITLVDYAFDLSESLSSVNHMEKRIISLNTNRGGLHFFSQFTDPYFEHKLSVKKTTGHIFGVEKPLLYIKNNSIYFQFQDSSFESSMLPELKEDQKVEMFYWSSDFPLLPLEQAYQTALYYKNNYSNKDSLWNDEPLSQEQKIKKFEDQGNIFKKILYFDSWNTERFQANKPNLLRNDWYFWLYENNEFDKLRKNWNISMNNITSGIDKRFLIDAVEVNVLRPLRTKPFYLMSLE